MSKHWRKLNCILWCDDFEYRADGQDLVWCHLICMSLIALFEGEVKRWLYSVAIGLLSVFVFYVHLLLSGFTMHQFWYWFCFLYWECHACAFICLIARENTKLRYIEPPVFYTDCCCDSCGEHLDLRRIVDTVIVAECVQCALWIGAKLCATWIMMSAVRWCTSATWNSVHSLNCVPCCCSVVYTDVLECSCIMA